MSGSKSTLRPIASASALVDVFAQSFKPRSHWRIGVESEKFGLYSATGTPLRYGSEHGIAALLQTLCDEQGWSPDHDATTGAVIALRKHQTALTLEPGGQVELSGAPARCVHEVCHEVSAHLEELAPFAKSMDIRWLALGFHPTATQEDLPWIPKERYAIMRQYLPQRGKRALDMMRRTSTVQVNLDFDSEQDAMRKLRVALKLQPITTAVFANSPFIEGRITEVRSQRAHVWLDVDPDRCGLLPFAWRTNATFEDYVQWALDVPMFFIQRGTQTLRNTGQTFRAFMSDGFQGQRATFEDWELHLSTLFPEVRMKHTIEVRGADAQGKSLLCAVPALWKGLLYDPTALDQAESLVEELDHDTVANARQAIGTQALLAMLGDKPVYTWAESMLDIAIQGLKRLNDCPHSTKDESRFLLPLQHLIANRQCPADVLLAHINPAQPLLEQLFEYAPA